MRGRLIHEFDLYTSKYGTKQFLNIMNISLFLYLDEEGHFQLQQNFSLFSLDKIQTS